MRFLVLFLMMFGAAYGTIAIVEHFDLWEWNLMILVAIGITVSAVISLCHHTVMKFLDRSRSVHDGRKE